jgi:GAF domain-containing protein
MSRRKSDSLAGSMAETFTAIEVLARALHAETAQLQPTLDVIVANAAAAYPVAQDAGLILYARGKLVPQAATGRAPQVLDLKQQQDQDGPCIHAAREQVVVQISDTKLDERWPRFSAAAQGCGVRSLLCVPLWVSERSMGALTLYSGQATAFSQGDTQLIGLFAALAALALAEAQRTEQLREAIASRDLIGQAKGILIERHRLTGDAAFSLLDRASQDANVKVAEVARHLVETGELLAGDPGS